MKITELVGGKKPAVQSTFQEKGDRKAPEHKYKIIYRRKGCVGGDICTFIDPENFKMNSDGKADMLKGEKQEDGSFVFFMEDPGMGDIGNPMRRAADSCPAGVISVIKMRTGERMAGH